MIEQISQLGGENGAGARSAKAGNTLYFLNTTEISHKILAECYLSVNG